MSDSVVKIPEKRAKQFSKKAVEGVSSKRVSRDLALIAARQVADSLIGMGLSPRDFADNEDLLTELRSKLKRAIESETEVFRETLVSALRNLG